ncbi:MAG: glycosyltransferase family 2 protein [Ruminococcus sp.]|nr:glycosyltransferase family 2 protein [Ruminococcus sp.]
MFDIAIALFLFKRTSGLERIISQIRKLQPSKIYLIADGPRNDSESDECIKCRKFAEQLIDWNCTVRKNYATSNRGVFNNIGNGAKWVFQYEEKAIFLEDDNYPELSFFTYCKEMLDKYEGEERILWICGTNYLKQMNIQTSYVFTQHLLPCGWASWAKKFNKFYDGELKGFNDPHKMETFKNSYLNKSLYRQQLRSIERTKYLLDTNIKKSSWDFQMLFSLRANNLLGIAPANNQIINIGADSFSVHGGTSMKNKMTSRFCLVETKPLSFPLISPSKIEINEYFEKTIGDIILYPFSDRVKVFLGQIVKFVLRINKYESISEKLRERKHLLRK